MIESAPDDTPARLTLTSAYVKSDKMDLARQVASEITQLDPDFSIKRFAETQYFRDASYLEQFCGDLRASGLPE